MCDIRAKILANDDMPGRLMAFFKLLLDLSCDILLNGVFFEGSRREINGLRASWCVDVVLEKRDS